MKVGIYNKYPDHLHFEPTSDCNARCPQCPRTFGASLLTNPELNVTEWSADDLKKVLDNDFFNDLKKVLINGNYGDIVMHTNPKEIISVFLDLKFQQIQINTNGGALGTEFWSWLGTHKNILVEFGIDGLDDTHHLYRRNTRFDIVMKNARAFIEAGGTASWAMTVFKHNEHQIDKCSKLAKEYGFSSFKKRPSTRWSGEDLIILDANMKESYRLEPATEIENRSSNLKNTSTECNIECSVAKQNSVYLSAEGKLYPCCWMAFSDQQNLNSHKKSSFIQKFYKDYDYGLDFNNVIKNKIVDIIKSKIFVEIENSWISDNQFDACKNHCVINSNRNRQLNKTKIKSYYSQ